MSNLKSHNLDDKLRDILFQLRMNPGELDKETLDNQGVYLIKQAFADEGWIDMKPLEVYEQIARESGLEVDGDTPDMTGQEWYDRFEEIVKNDTKHFTVNPNLSKDELPTAIVNKVLEAAKKASNL